MSIITYEQLALAWKPDLKRDNIFNFISIIVLSGFLVGGLIISSIPIPKQNRSSDVVVPERIAKFITERPKPKVIPPPVVKPLPPPSPLTRAKKPEHKKPLTKMEKKARNKAEKSGLLALTTQLSDLMDTKSVDKMVSGRLRSSKNANTVASVSSKVLTAKTGAGSAGVNHDIYNAGNVEGSKLDDNQLRVAKKLLASHGQVAIISRKKTVRNDDSNVRTGNVRAEEDVAYVMDKHKSILHALYRRARRSHPGLQGKIVLELTILPSGKVSRVRVVSSELNDRKLEKQLLERIRLFDFGARPVKTLTLTIPVEFLPS